MRTKLLTIGAVTLGACTALAASSPGGFASTAGGAAHPTARALTRFAHGIGTPRFTVQRPAGAIAGTAGKRFNTIPFWSSKFTDPTNGQTYRYTMVGTDPHAGGAITTTIPTMIIPMKFRFESSADPNLHVLDGSEKVAQTVDSPVFQAADIGMAANRTASSPPPPPIAGADRKVREPSDVTQVGDAIYRAQFHKTGSGFHVLLGQPTVASKATFYVPSSKGRIVIGPIRSGTSTRSRIGMINYGWFSQQLQSVMQSRHISPKVLPIFLVNNSFLYIHNTANCCVLGYHGASQTGADVNTYMFASYSDPGVFAPKPGDKQSYVQDIHGLSHEVQEWYDDPFVNNLVDP